MIRVTPAALAVTLVTRPTSPAPFTTASYTCTPLVLPTLIVAVEYQAVVGRATTRPVTSRTPLGKILWSRSLTMARSSSFSACVVSSWATPTRSCSTSFLSSLFSDFALKRSPAQFQASRNGLVDRAVPFCSGATTRRTTLCAPRAMPLSDSRKYNVSMATESSSRIATTIRRRSTRRRFISQRRTELPTPRPGVALALDEDIELLEILAGAHSHARERRLRQMHRHLRLFAQALGQTLQQRPAAGEHDPAVHDVAGKLRRRVVAAGSGRAPARRDADAGASGGVSAHVRGCGLRQVSRGVRCPRQEQAQLPAAGSVAPVSYTHLTLPTNREV